MQYCTSKYVLLRVVVCIVLTTFAWVIDDFRVRALLCVPLCIVWGMY